MAVLASGSDDMIRAANLVDLAVVEAADDPAARARALATSAIIDMDLERRARAESRYKEALTLFEQVGDARGVADILDARAMAVFLDGDIGTAVDAFDRVAQLFVDSGNLLRVVTPRSTRGHALVVAGRPREVWQTPRRLWICRGPSATRKARRWSCGRTARRSPHSGGPRRPNTPLRTPCRSRSVSVAVAGRPRRCAASVSRTRPPATCQPPRTRSAGSLHKSQHLPLFWSWAHARLALLLVAMGRLEEAATHVDRALAMGPPLGQFEARVARCVLAVVRRQPNTSEMLQDAVHRATAGGHRASQARLSMLIDSWEAVSSTATHGDR